MKNKTYISIIVFLSFALIIGIVLNNSEQTDSTVAKELNKEIETLNKRVQDLESLEKENLEIKRQVSVKSSENTLLKETLTETTINTALLNSAEIEGALLNLNMTPINLNVCQSCKNGYELIQVEEDTSKTITKDVPIFLLDESNDIFEVEWEHLINLDRTPLLLLFEKANGILFIREEYHPLRLKSREEQEELFKLW